MPKLKIFVEYTVERVVVLDNISQEELDEMTFEDAICNCEFDAFETTAAVDTNIVTAYADDHLHFFK